MKAITKQQRRKLVALSAIVGTLIAVGVTAVAGGGLYYAFQSQTDPFTTSSSMDVRNLNAVLDDNTLKVTATLKNSGQTSLTTVYIDSISVSDVNIEQTRTNSTYYPIILEIDNVVRTGTIDREKGIGIGSILEGGRTNAFVLEITYDDTNNANDLGSNINISDRLSLTLAFTSGQDELLTDVFATRVKPG